METEHVDIAQHLTKHKNRAQKDRFNKTYITPGRLDYKKQVKQRDR